MVSRKQLEANRRNSQRSTGPRTAVGKRRSSMNALKHGLSSQEIVIFDEDPLEFEGLRAALEEAFQPVDAFERELVDQLAGLFWRLRRIPKLEAEF